MIRLKHILSCLTFLLAAQVLNAQTLKDEKNRIIELRVDFLLDNNEGGDNDYTTLFEQLQFYYEHPLNLNSANKDDLDQLMLLSDIQINNLLIHIEKNGPLITMEELQSIDGFDLEVIRFILPFSKVSGDLDQPSLNLKDVLKEGSSQWFVRYTRVLEEQEGFSPISAEELEDNPNARYLGSPDKLFTRYRFSYANNLSIGFTAEKDAGEEFFQGSQPDGFDFYSGHLFLQDFGTLKQLAIGDFQAQFGQGLTFWSGLAFGISPDIQTLKRNAPSLRPYTSVQEDLFLRGGGATIALKDFELTMFYSGANVDANLDGRDTLTNEIVITSLSEDGFHRTENELADKNAILNEYLGGHLAYKKRNINVGVTAVRNEIDADFQPAERVYNQFSNLDNENTNVGLDYNYIYKNANFFGEVSHTLDGGYATTNGALIVLDPRLSVAVQYRNYERDFQPIQSNAIGESSTNTNEKGMFLGLNARLAKPLFLSAFFNRFEFPWLRFQTDGPSNGFRYLTQLNYEPNKRMTLYFRLRGRKRGRNESINEEGIDPVVTELLTNYRLHLSYQVTKSVQIKSRVEFSDYRLGNESSQSERGILVYQDLNYAQLSSPISFSLRYAIFDTDGFNSRIYAYENDVLYAFSIPAYSGRGTRFYINAKYHIRRGLDLWLRYAQTYFTDRDVIGTGRDEINGNTRSEIKAQLRLKF